MYRYVPNVWTAPFIAKNIRMWVLIFYIVDCLPFDWDILYVVRVSVSDRKFFTSLFYSAIIA
jgi:hypothetical protein